MSKDIVKNQIKEFDKYLDELLKALLAIINLDFTYRLQVSDTESPLSAISEAVNITSQEMGALISEITLQKDFVDNIIKSIIDTLIVINPDATVRTVNRATVELLGYEEKELLGQPVGRFLEEEDTIFKDTRLKKMIAEGAIKNYALTYKTKSGEKIPVSFSGSVMRDKKGGLVGLVGIARDMREILKLQQKEKEFAVATAVAESEKKKAEELRKTNEEIKSISDRLQFLLSATPAVIYVSKAYGDYGATFISENVRQQIGYEPDEFLKDSGFWASHIHPDDSKRIFEGLSMLFERGYHIHEYRFMFKDGQYRWMHDEMKLIKDKDGKPIEITGYWTDITKRKKMEKEIKEKVHELEVFKKAAVDRELKMIELKNRIKELENEKK